MSIVAGELKEYKSETVSDESTNGGRISANAITDNANRNVFPDVTEAQRTSGVTQYRKVFHKVENDDDDTLSSARIHMTQITDGDDRVTLFEGTQTDTQADISSPDEYGVGTLKSNVSGGGTSLICVLENSAMTIFRDADTIWIGDGTNEEYHENVTISKNGDEVTITLAAGDSLQNAYLAATPTYIASVIEYGDIEASVDNYGGTALVFDSTTYPVTPDHIGTIEDTWTITIGAGGAFTCSGANTGAVTSGNTSANFAPSNGDFTKPYFTLNSNGWNSPQQGDTFTFQTHPAAAPIWRKRVVPAGASAASGNNYKVQTKGETS